MSIYDYLLLSLVLALSIFIGLYYAYEAKYGSIWQKRITTNKRTVVGEKDGRQMQQYLVAGGEMHFVPLAFSLLASSFSATAMLGYPGIFVLTR